MDTTFSSDGGTTNAATTARTSRREGKSESFFSWKNGKMFFKSEIILWLCIWKQETLFHNSKKASGKPETKKSRSRPGGARSKKNTENRRRYGMEWGRLWLDACVHSALLLLLTYPFCFAQTDGGGGGGGCGGPLPRIIRQ